MGKRCKPWIVLKNQDSTAPIISHVLDANTNEANQYVGKKSITQDLHQVKSIVKKENKWSMLIPAPWFFAPTVLKQ
ncbi:1339_t:CDS:2, partial [Dentiscutata heterogama]